MATRRVTVTVRCYEELNDFLPVPLRKRPFAYGLPGGGPLSALLEALGITASAVELALRNGESIGLDGPLREGNRISLYPVFESFDVGKLVRLRSAPLRDTRFIADAHLGKLARYLRLAGFDTLFCNPIDDGELVTVANREGRIVLSRDRGIFRRSQLQRGYRVRSERPQEQLSEVLARLDLTGGLRPFSRCLCCNRLVEPVPAHALGTRISVVTRSAYSRFWCCPGCGRIYWEGAHFRRMQGLLLRAADAARAAHII